MWGNTLTYVVHSYYADDIAYLDPLNQKQKFYFSGSFLWTNG